MKQQFVDFLKDKSGNFGLMLALLMAPLVLAMGVAIDYGHATAVKSELQTAADAAAVGVLSEQSVGVIEALSKGLTGKLVLAEKDADAMFTANLDAKSKGYIKNYTVSVNRANDKFTSSVKFNATVPTSFLMMFGKNTIDVAGVAEGSYVPASYIDFYLMLDNSPSMGLGATTADITKLEANTSDTCAFACHIEGSTNDYYSLAKKLGVTTRIEVVSLAAQKMMETATKTRRFSDQYRMAVYSMGEKATNVGLKNVASMSSDMDDVQEETDEIELMSIPYQGYDNDQQTDFSKILTSLRTEIGKGGTGINASDRQKVMFFVTDGVNDSYLPSGCKKKTTSGRCQSPMDFDLCTKIKDKGVRIAVLYTTYLSIDNNDWYKSWIKPFRTEIGPALESCATPGLYFEVSPSQGITEAMNALFMKVVNMPRLTM